MNFKKKKGLHVVAGILHEPEVTALLQVFFHIHEGLAATPAVGGYVGLTSAPSSARFLLVMLAGRSKHRHQQHQHFQML